MSRQSGFTLLELLIAMTLMGLILVMLYGGLRLGMRSWEAGEKRAETVNEIRLVQDLMRRQFKQSVTTFRNDEDEGRIIAFQGMPESVSLVTPMLTYLGLGGLYFVQIDTVENHNSGQLRMRWWPYQPESTDDEEHDDIAETILLNDISEVQWTYFGPSEPGQEPEWHDQWENSAELPILARLRLTFHGAPWPELVMVLPN